MSTRTYAPRQATAPAWKTRPATDAQLRYAGDLIAKRVTTGLGAADLATMAAIAGKIGVTGGECSALIDALKAAPYAPRAPREAEPQSSVPAGRYALPHAEDVIAFVQVDRPEKGRYAGRVFVKRLYGAPGDFRKVDLPRAEQARILAVLEADTLHDVFRDDDDVEHVQSLTGPRAAAVRFSRHFTVCSACLSPLSDALSRQRGLGPVCATRY